ncbi:MAG: tRNA (adenosine(37)-N6)-threonylcarbamoyltransferase complex ATPase subunit type 1 TsaE [Candidatus Omnitrophica bacterium]|nr:tRNA (adenosine(37)-N6)-threonylcarbamoyltransferase complex ATPase subunit type 1 TsaE [Candidatus Omnitrophota bacterium]
MKRTFNSHSARQTRALGARLGRILEPGDIICLFGQLGAGKTVFTRGIARGIGVDPDAVTSPSFVLLHVHTGTRMPLYHFDFYRLSSAGGILRTGYEEYLHSDGVSAIEWPERLGYLLPDAYLKVSFGTGKERLRRRLVFGAHGKRYRSILEAL